MKKIAFLFLIIDNPNFPKIWDKYLDGNEDKYTIYIHPKYPKKHTWKPNNIIKELKETGWGYITEAYLELFKASIDNKDNYKFITISESCLPIKTFDNFYNDVINDKRSWIKKMKIKNWDMNERVIKHIEKMKNNDIYIPEIKTMFKHYARFCLNRAHTEQLVKINSKNKLNFYHKMHVADEFFLSILFPLNNYRDFAVTYDDWDYVENERNYINKLIKESYEFKEKFNIDMDDEIKELKFLRDDLSKNPKTIIDVVPDLNKIIHCKSYFYRKFAKTSNINKYWNILIKFSNK